MHFVSQLYRMLWYQIDGWDTQQWLLAFAVVVASGVVMLRGFGSRTTY